MVRLIIRIVLLLIIFFRGRAIWKKLGESDNNDRREDNKPRETTDSSEEEVDDSEDEDETPKITRAEIVRKLIESDERFEGDEFILGESEDEDYDTMYAGQVRINDQDKFEIELYAENGYRYTPKDVINSARLYTDYAKNMIPGLKMYIRTVTKDEKGNEVSLNGYRNLSDLPKGYTTSVIILVNKGSDNDIVDLLYILTNSMNIPEFSDDEGTFIMNGREVRVVLSPACPLELKF